MKPVQRRYSDRPDRSVRTRFSPRAVVWGDQTLSPWKPVSRTLPGRMSWAPAKQTSSPSASAARKGISFRRETRGDLGEIHATPGIAAQEAKPDAQCRFRFAAKQEPRPPLSRHPGHPARSLLFRGETRNEKASSLVSRRNEILRLIEPAHGPVVHVEVSGLLVQILLGEAVKVVRQLPGHLGFSDTRERGQVAQRQQAQVAHDVGGQIGRVPSCFAAKRNP